MRNQKTLGNSLRSYFSKPANVITVIFLIVLLLTVVLPLSTLLIGSFKVNGNQEAIWIGEDGVEDGSWTFHHWIELLTSKEFDYAKTKFWIPLGQSAVMAILACIVAVVFGGVVAWFITRSDLPAKKFISTVFVFPYIMPSWSMAMFWENFFKNTQINAGMGILQSVTGICVPESIVYGLFPCAMSLGLHYAPFAYILIGGIFRNMDANLEEAATILDTPRWKTMFRITLPMIKPAILSTVLLVFGSAMGSYPVPHYLNFETLSTKYISMNDKYSGEASILAIIMMVFGVAILLANQLTLKSRKSYTTVTGKSGQISRFNLGNAGKYVIGAIFIVITFFTSIYPIISFAFETFLPNPGDYSFLYTGNIANLTTKWWITAENVTENGMYGQFGMLYNKTIWHAYGGTMLVSVACALTAGTIGTLIGYAVSKNRRSKWANYVNNIAFLPYLMPSIAVGVAFFILFSNKYVNLFNTYWLLIIVGTVKYIPFASRASLNSMLQLSGEIEEAAIIQDIPWFKRMFRIIVPIQKSSIISGYLLPFMTCLRELSLFMLLCVQGFILSTTLDYFDEMGLYAFSSGINLILVVTILISNAIVNKLTGASLDEGIGG